MGGALTKPAYVPSRWQSIFHQTPYDEVLGAGAAGPGKTLCLLMDPLEQIFIEHERCRNPEHKFHQAWGDSTGWALHLRRTLKQLLQSIQRTHRIFPKIDPDAKYDTQNHMWIFSSGYRYQFGHCKDKNSWEDYFSNEYTHLGFDELVQFYQEQYDQLYTRVRSSDPILSMMLKRRAMSNPLMDMDPGDSFHVENPHWVRDYFIKWCKTGNTIKKFKIVHPDGEIEYRRRLYLPASINDNPDPNFARQYRGTLLTRPKHIQEALLKGNWYFVPNAFFGEEWDEQIHTCNPFRVPRDWPVFRAMDWGHKKFGCIGWFTLDEEDSLLMIKEFSFRGMVANEVAARVREIEEDAGWWNGEQGSRLVGVADPQIWEERGTGDDTIATKFHRAGIRWIAADRSNRRGSSGLLLERLHDHAEHTKLPGIRFFRTCKRSIDTIPVIPADPNDSEQPLDGGEDHWCDMVRYACSLAARGRKGIPKMAPIKEEWEIQEEIARSRQPLTRSSGPYGEA